MPTYQERAAYITAYPPPPEPRKMSTAATVLHIIMCFATIGLWIPIWVIHATSVNKAALKEVQTRQEYWAHVERYFPTKGKG